MLALLLRTEQRSLSGHVEHECPDTLDLVGCSRVTLNKLKVNPHVTDPVVLGFYIFLFLEKSFGQKNLILPSVPLFAIVLRADELVNTVDNDSGTVVTFGLLNNPGFVSTERSGPRRRQR
ncbi:uncharacterized protein V6R79_023271 [Siganus canaliculatus]